MSGLVFKLDMTPLVAVQNAVYQAALQRLHGAVEGVLVNMAADWQTAVHKARLWSGERTAYADSITWRMTGDLKGEVEATYRLAEQIENGRPSYDLKQMLGSSLKTRVSKKGARYLIIPFRHNTPGYTAHADDMPDHVYAIARTLAQSRITGMGTRASGTGALDINTRKALQVPQAKYFWGGRLDPGSMGPNPKGKVDRFAGMVRFEDTAAKGKPKSIYMTFRVMTEHSKGWIIGPRPGLKLADGLTQKWGPIAQQEFIAAVKGEV